MPGGYDGSLQSVSSSLYMGNKSSGNNQSFLMCSSVSSDVDLRLSLVIHIPSHWWPFYSPMIEPCGMPLVLAPFATADVPSIPLASYQLSLLASIERRRSSSTASSPFFQAHNFLHIFTIDFHSYNSFRSLVAQEQRWQLTLPSTFTDFLFIGRPQRVLLATPLVQLPVFRLDET